MIETLSEFQASLLPFLDPAKIHKATAEPGEPIPVVARFRKILQEQNQSTAAGRERKGVDSAAGRSARPRLHIKAFGRFEVFRGATAIDVAEWGGKQPQLLLKALISREGRSVPKDVLIEDLWPEVDTASGDRNFKVTLHRLRKALEPAADRTEGSSYVHLRNHMVSLDGSLCHVDVDEFVSWCRNGRRSEEGRKAKEALSAYEKAVSVYEGDYLAEDLYAPWAAGRRERLRSEFLEVLYRMGALYEMAGSHKTAAECYARLLRIDPASEQACQRLMIVYSNRGMRSAALKVYEDCKKALRDEIGVVPDTLTDSIYRKILEQE
ncbi:MAG: BTAD domain-containing putative transcriptional regulator [Syntrophobacteraceae bacterium]